MTPRRTVLALLMILLAGTLPVALRAGENPACDEEGFEEIARIHTELLEYLTELEKTGGGASPEELLKQAEADRRFPVDLPWRPLLRLPKSAPRIYRRSCESVVLIGKSYLCGKCTRTHVSTASGFAVGPDGLMLTTRHTFTSDEKGKAAAVRTFRGDMFPILEVVAVDVANDLVLFRTEARDLRPLPVARDVTVGESVYAIHHPVQRFFAFTAGIVAGKMVSGHPGHERRDVAITADFAKGSSGGPVLNRKGEVVAVIARTQPVYYDKKDGVDTNIQMVWKLCSPSFAILRMMEAEDE